MINVFKQLYPEPKEIVSWQGNNITIDARYVFNEMVNMARMLRFKDEVLTGDDILSKMNIKW